MPEDYSGGRTADTIVKWVNDKIGTNRKIKKAPSSVRTLTTGDFDKHATGKAGALVKFYAPWCGHCKTLAPIFEDLGKVYAGDTDVVIAKVDATEENDLGTKYEVKGFPTLKWFPPGSSEPEDYNSGRDLASLIEFINEKTGLQRLEDGSLSPTAGKVKVLDDIIKQQNYNIDATTITSLKSVTETLVGKELESGKKYISIAEKVLNKGKDYIANEMARLGGMLKNPGVAAEKKTTFQLKQNVLRAFMDA